VIDSEETIVTLAAEQSDSLEIVFKKICLKRGVKLLGYHYQFRYFVINEKFASENEIDLTKKIIQHHQNTETILNYKEEVNLNNLSMKMQVKDLESRELLLISKYFVDFPYMMSSRKIQNCDSCVSLSQPNTIQTKKTQALFNSFVIDSNLSEDEILLNEISATNYKEYEVRKTNNQGFRQARVLGLDRYYLYNEKRKKANTFINTVLPEIYVKTATTAIPIIKISDIVRVERNKDFQRKFTIEFIKPEKTIEKFYYEAATLSEAAEIIVRLRYLMKLNAEESKMRVNLT